MADTYYFKDDLYTKHLFDDKESIVRILTTTMLKRCIKMFDVKGLPETIPINDFLYQIIVCGHADIIQISGKWYSMVGQLGGAPNAYARPIFTTITNPAFPAEITGTYSIKYDYDRSVFDIQKYKGEAYVIRMSDDYSGLVPLITFYTRQLAENILSKKMATINMRAPYIFIANDDNEYKDFKDFYKNLTDGKMYSIRQNSMIRKVETLPFSGGSSSRELTQLIEDQQYIKASLFNSIGLQANYNMKRESINSNEAQLNEDELYPLIDYYEMNLKNSVAIFNKYTGNNLVVSKSSSWAAMQKELDNVLQKQISELKKPDTEKVQISGSEGNTDET